MSTVYFISGGNRRIGFSLVKELSSDSQNIVIASARDPEKATELQEWSRKHQNTKIVTLDISNEDSIASLSDQVSKFTDAIDVLISNAGIFDETAKELLRTKTSSFNRLFTINSVGPVLLVGTLNPFLSKKESPKTIFISSIAGSIGGFDFDGFGAYGASKAALNFHMKILSLGSKNHTFVSIHPGVVSSDMGKVAVKQMEAADLDLSAAGIEVITPDESASKMVKVINGLTIKDTGLFLNYEGEHLPF